MAGGSFPFLAAEPAAISITAHGADVCSIVKKTTTGTEREREKKSQRRRRDRVWCVCVGAGEACASAHLRLGDGDHFILLLRGIDVHHLAGSNLLAYTSYTRRGVRVVQMAERGPSQLLL